MDSSKESPATLAQPGSQWESIKRETNVRVERSSNSSINSSRRTECIWMPLGVKYSLPSHSHWCHLTSAPATTPETTPYPSSSSARQSPSSPFMLTTTTGSRAVSSISRDVTGREVTATYPIITVLMKASLIINSLPTTSTFGIPYMSICIGQLLQADTLVPRYSPVYHRPPIQKSLLWMGSPPA